MDKKIAARAPTAPSERLGFLLYRCGLAISRGYERALKPIGSAPVDAGVLSALAYQGPNHVRGLARLLGLGRQTMVNVTRHLEADGLIERSASPGDARLSLFSITSAGAGRLERIEEIASIFDQKLSEMVGRDAELVLNAQLLGIIDAPFLAYED